MADCTATTLINDSRCLAAALGDQQLLAVWANLICGGGPPPTDFGRITEEGDPRFTEEGDHRITEEQ